MLNINDLEELMALSAIEKLRKQLEEENDILKRLEINNSISNIFNIFIKYHIIEKLNINITI